MAKTKILQAIEDGTKRDVGSYAWIFCPGCKGYHSLRIRMPAAPTQREIDNQRNNIEGLWQFVNDDVNKPTFRASLLVGNSTPGYRCHSYITNGRMEYLNDCDHELRGTTVDLPDIDL